MIFNQYIHKNSVDSQKDHFSKKIVYIVKNNLGAAKCTTGATQPHLACSSRLVFRKTQIQIHNTTTSLSHPFLQYNLPYFVPYKWRCNGGSPYCIPGNTKASGPGSCSHQVRIFWQEKATFLKLFEIPQLCECDREFVQCLADFPCPKKKAMCRSESTWLKKT